MAHFFLISKDVPICEQYVKNLAAKLLQDGNQITLGEHIDFKQTVITPLFTKEKIPDYVVTVGGDGTILLTVQHMPIQVPLIGINFGDVGFLADLDPEIALEFLKQLAASERSPSSKEVFPKINPRMRISFVVDGTYAGTALNEAVIITDRPSKMLKLTVFIDGVQAEEFRADGLITSTPTGSTAYSMSGGGPIVDPRLEAYIMVPMAPFILTNRPHLIQTQRSVSIRLSGEKPARLVIDGQNIIKLKCNCTITVQKSSEPALFVDAGENFFEKVTRKLRHL
jgi:NAD+ kinase